MKDDVYFFHQTPITLCKELMKYVSYEDGDILFEPFKGEGNFYNCFPTSTTNVWTEIEEGRCYTSYRDKIDWVITNPPFRIIENGKRENTFYKVLNYFADRAEKGICILGNFSCFFALTPKRMSELNKKGFYLNQVVLCNVKAWKGRYYFMIFTKEPNDSFKYMLSSF